MSNMIPADAAAATRVRVQAMRLEADQIVSIDLVSTSGHPLPDWTSGAHIDVVLPSGAIRQYSLCGEPDDKHTYRIGVLRQDNGRGGSVEVHDQLRVGAELDIRGPRNHFPLNANTTTHVFVAGGIGITPILSHVRAANARGDEWTLVYGARSRGAMAFLSEIETMNPARIQLVAEDTDGRVDLPGILRESDPEAAIYCCGPAGLLNVAEETVPANRLHLERFVSSGLAPSQAAGSFDVVFQRSGMTAQIGPKASILDAAIEAGIEPLWSCREGICGTCITPVIEGEPEHLDDILSDEERAANDQMLICVSRCKSGRLVLDL